MKVSEAVQHMTKAYLQRIIDSFTRDFPKTDEERAREIIVKNAEELTDPARTADMLRFEAPYGERILQSYILEGLINRPEHRATEEELVQEVLALEEEILAAAEDPDALRYEDGRAIEVLGAVLEVAIEDEKVTPTEFHLIRRLREKLGLRERAMRILLARLEHFPRSGNRPHRPSEFKDTLTELQRRGIVFYLNRLDGGVYLIPDEIVGGVKAALGVEVTRRGWFLLLGSLTNEHLSTILGAAGLPRYGTKEERVDRVTKADVRPGAALHSLSNQDLYDVCKSLPGAKVSGTKEEKIARLLDYFDSLVVKDVPQEATPGELYYQYLAELAKRDRESLLANGVISKDRQMDDAFEEGTRYLFEAKLGLDLRSMEGSDHCDGCMEFGRSGDLFMWDNKSRESVYTFPPSHARQFKRYIRDAGSRVSCFLVIAPEIGGAAARQAAKLKVESGTDTDVALISAEDLKWVAEVWLAKGLGKPFDLEVFNVTGVLDRPLLEERMSLFL